MGLGDFRSSILVVLVLSLFSGFAGGPPAFADSGEDCADLLRPVFYTDPSSVEWKRDLRKLCPVSNQGLLSTCWASAGASFLKPMLVRAGLMKTGENLSRDYYSAVIMHEFAWVYRKGKMEIFQDELGPYFSTEVFHTMLSSGIVLEGEYRFPRIPVSTPGGVVRLSDVRMNSNLLEEFIEELNEVRTSRSPARFQEVLNTYLGDPSRITPRPVPEALIEANEPEVLVTDPGAWKRLQEDGLAPGSARFFGPDENKTVEARVRASLEAGNPVMVTISKLEHFEAMRSGEASLIREITAEGEFGGEHAVTILGYGRGADGKIWYLLQNNGGKRWGHQGVIAVSGDFLRTEVERFVILR